MPVLRISQQPTGTASRYRIEVSATEIPGIQPPSFSREIEFELAPQDNERIRWYLEDYLQFDEDPAPQLAKGVETFMAECGEELFRSIFESSPQGLQLWTIVEPYLPRTRIEITTGIAEATAIPWELIRNPTTRTFLALSADSFVRTQREVQNTLTPQGEADKVRILLVICRPEGGGDVPFRSVAGRLVTRLSDDARNAFNLDVLRPPTYEQLAMTLRLAKDGGRPYHIVHFDGHGAYASKLGRGLLAFENPYDDQNNKFVDGFDLGALLRDAGVALLVLNACQSAYAEAKAHPQAADAKTAREEIEAYGSLAQAVIEAGVAGVVAMRYSVYVVTAAQFVAELYGSLARGRRLGEAVTWARKNLHDQPERRIANEARALQDWSVPVVWERAPFRLWPEKSDAATIKIILDDGSGSKQRAFDRALPTRPDVGFYGRDETLYALDRAFDTHRIVLLHAFAGSGKTSTAAEFARWYSLTGGVKGPVLFTSFEHYLPLARVLDKIGMAFGKALESANLHWDAIIDAAQRRDVALQVLQQVPLLWIWDNIEPVTGFPAGTASDWSAAEQEELREFLRDARETKAKFLLTSRRNESTWLGELVRRVPVPPMPIQERLELASAIATQRGKRLADFTDLTPLLKFTRGNPLTILVTVGLALRARIDTKPQLHALVEALRRGEVVFDDEANEGRSKSLGASLSYGFQTAFDDRERKILALLHLFQNFIDIRVLRAMTHPEAPWCLNSLRSLKREDCIALFDRAVEIGLLEAQENGGYSIHPALPWYFRTLFEHYFPQEFQKAATRAFVGAMGELGHHYFAQYEAGDRNAILALAAQEENLVSAWRAARTHGWWDSMLTTTQGLEVLYHATGRRGAWRRLVEDIVPYFIDPANDGPLAGRELTWGMVTGYRARVLSEDRNWEEAERLLRLVVDKGRIFAQSALAVADGQLDQAQHQNMRALASSLNELASFLRNQGKSTCVDVYQEALDIARRIGDVTVQIVCAFNLGHAYCEIADLRNLDEAERWYQTSADLRPKGDSLGRGRSIAQLGMVAYERFIEARREREVVERRARYLAQAAQLYHQANDMVPATAINERATFENQLGLIYSEGGDIERALDHYRQCIHYQDQVGNVFAAGQVRANVARTFAVYGQLTEARAYAVAALDNFRTFGDRAAREIEYTERLLTSIDEAIATTEAMDD